MIVFIPLSDGQTIPFCVLLGLGAQTVPCDIVPLVTTGIVRSNHDEMDRHKRAYKLNGECEGRNKAKDFLKKYYQDQSYCVMMDSDMVLNDPTAFYKARNVLIKDKGVNAVSLPKQPDGKITHWDLAVVMYRVSWLLEYTFHFDDRLHLCNTVFDYLGITGTTLYSKDKMCYEISRNITKED